MVIASTFRKIWKSYLFRNSAIFGAVMAASEVSQETVLNFEHYDAARIARVGFYGCSFHAPANHFWLVFIERIFPGSSFKSVLFKTGIGQFTINPFLISTFYAGINLLEGKSDIFTELREKFWTTYAVGFVFWPPVLFVVYRVIPFNHRLAVVSVFSFIWGNFLCYMKTLDMHKNGVKSTENKQLDEAAVKSTSR
ncbi:mpv17-like protein [Ptychodera flava]|uniref:mpv17-like protein n=1 Tax=Ptychodera flava TaxID=63121 RepID=UPI00396A4F73